MKTPLCNTLILLLAAFAAGCAGTSPSSNFYLLTPVAEAPAGPGVATGLAVGVGPVRLAAHLEREQIVARSGSNTLEINEFDRWGGSLERNVADVVAENLSRLLGTDAVLVSPWSNTVEIDYQVALDVRTLERIDGGPVRLVAQWRLFRGGDEELVEIRRTVIDETVGGPGYDAQAAAESRALAKLSAEIARSIRSRGAS